MDTACFSCKGKVYGTREVIEKDNAIIEEFYCKGCQKIMDRQFKGYKNGS